MTKIEPCPVCKDWKEEWRVRCSKTTFYQISIFNIRFSKLLSSLGKIAKDTFKDFRVSEKNFKSFERVVNNKNQIGVFQKGGIVPPPIETDNVPIVITVDGSNFDSDVCDQISKAIEEHNKLKLIQGGKDDQSRDK